MELNNTRGSKEHLIKYDVQYGDTWYGIAEAKYGSKGYRQTMEIVKYLKSLNNVNPHEEDIQEELSMMDTITLKNGKTFKYKEDAPVDIVHNSDVNNEHEINVQQRLKVAEKAKLEAEKKAEEKEKIDSVNFDNTGAIGLVILNPGVYKEVSALAAEEKKAHNTAKEIKMIEDILKNKNSNVTKELRDKLISALKNKKLAFAFNTTVEKCERELLCLTSQDVELLLKYADKASQIKSNDKLLAEEVNLRKEYFKNHRIVVPEEYIDDKSQVLKTKACKEDYTGEKLISNNETTVNLGAKKPFARGMWNATLEGQQQAMASEDIRIGFATVKDKGVNPYAENGQPISDVDRAFAEYASNVAKDLSTTGFCFTGLKHSLLTAGVIKDYGAIRDNNDKIITTPKNAGFWFQDRPEMFTEIKYVQDEDGEYRKINSADLYDLPAGYIILYSPENAEEYKDEAGHACVTNGNRQSYGDHTDALHWENFKKSEHGTFQVFKLNDENWKYNSETQKLEYTGPRTQKIVEDDKFAANTRYKEMGENAAKFQKSLVNNKEILMKTLNISEEKYERYKALAQAISVVETNAGNSNETKFLDKLENIEFVNELATTKYGPLSAGMTQIKASILSNKEKDILGELGVTTSDVNNLDEPEKSAIATVVHLNRLEQDYKKYLSNDDIGIIRTKEDLSKQELNCLNKFIETLTEKEQWNKLLLVKNILQGKEVANTKEEQELVEGAKIFVDTCVEKLSEEEYVAARWNGKTRTKPSDETKAGQLNRYYDNMLQVYIDRARIAILNGKNVEIKPAVLSKPDAYSYIGKVTYYANLY